MTDILLIILIINIFILVYNSIIIINKINIIIELNKETTKISLHSKINPHIPYNSSETAPELVGKLIDNSVMQTNINDIKIESQQSHSVDEAVEKLKKLRR